MKEYEIEAETIEEAREQIKFNLPKNHIIISEQVLSDGVALKIERTVEADNLEDATKEINHLKPDGFHVVSVNEIKSEKIVRTITSNKKNVVEDLIKTCTDLPKDITIIEEKVLSLPERIQIKIRSFKEKDAYSIAKSQIEKKYGSTAVIENHKLLSRGRKGFLGLGRKPDIFFFLIMIKPAVIEVTCETKNKYIFNLKETTKPKAKVAFKVGKESEVIAQRKEAVCKTRSKATKEPLKLAECELCGTDIFQGYFYGHAKEISQLSLLGFSEFFFCKWCMTNHLGDNLKVGNNYILPRKNGEKCRITTIY